MMKLEKVDSSHPKWSEIWRVYEQSFPTKERRSARAHACAQTDSDFTTVAAFDSDGNFAALLFYWEYDNTVYVEHLAVNPVMRGRNVGSRLMSDFLASVAPRTVVLEIEPPEDEMSRRRKKFYQRLGMVACDFDYVHPSFASGENARPHPLVLMSYPEALTSEQYDRFVEYMRKRVLRYID